MPPLPNAMWNAMFALPCGRVRRELSLDQSLVGCFFGLPLWGGEGECPPWPNVLWNALVALPCGWVRRDLSPNQVCCGMSCLRRLVGG